MPKTDVKVIEALAVMARYNPFFEKAGMIRVDYERDETSLEKRIKSFLASHSFNFELLRSTDYCRSFFDQLGDGDKRVLTDYLSGFAEQPFIKIERVTPELLTKVFASDCTYLYWVNPNRMTS